MPELPRVLGHQIVGEVAGSGGRFEAGRARRRPLARLDATATCPLLHAAGARTSAPRARFTGLRRRRRLRRARGGRRALLLPDPRRLPRLQAAPLLCAGLIGYRALRLAGDARRLGLYGFGAAAHIIAQVARHQGGACSPSPAPGDDGGAGVRARARRGVGGRLGRRAARAARRGDHLRARSARWSRRRCARPRGRRASSAAAST